MIFAMTAVTEDLLNATEPSAWAKVLLAPKNQRCEWQKKFPLSFEAFTKDYLRESNEDVDAKKLNAAFAVHMVCFTILIYLIAPLTPPLY
jgi:uncharacterized protein YeaO (DUF488 family)